MNAHWQIRKRDERQKIECWDFEDRPHASGLTQACHFASNCSPEEEATLHWIGTNGISTFVDWV